jgi:hypothetical protein
MFHAELLFVQQIEFYKYIIKIWSFCNVFDTCVFTKKPVFGQNKYTNEGCKGEKGLHRRKTVFCLFVYLCASCHANYANLLKTPTARGLEELFSAVTERFLHPTCNGCGW